MTPTTADELAKRIINTWRSGPALTEWRDELETLDEGRAGTAFMRLRHTSEHSPSIARFISEYRALQTTDGSTEKVDCADCDNTGWVSAPDIVLNAGTDREYRNTQVRPCTRCDYGKQAERSTVWTNRNNNT